MRRRLLDFTPAALSVPCGKGGPYHLPDAVDAKRPLAFIKGEREWVQRRVFDDVALKRCSVLWSCAPESDWDRRSIIAGQSIVDRMGDVMKSMTDKANPEEWILSSQSPNYAAQFLAASMPPERAASFVTPLTMDDFAKALDDMRPELVLLSGLNVNTRALLEMATLAREFPSVKEVWLGNYAALGPYKILDDFFDRIMAGPGERRLYDLLVGDGRYEYRHPSADNMLAEISWLHRNDGGEVIARKYKTLHLSLHLGCTQSCSYCAEGQWSEKRGVLSAGRKRSSEEILLENTRKLKEAYRVIDEAYAKGVRSVYFIDPDFGRPWEEMHTSVISYLANKGMRWSCLSNIVTQENRREWMIDHGLASVYLGIESLAPSHMGTVGKQKGKRVLGVMDRGWQNQDDTENLIRSLRDRVMIFGLYILGNPGETDASMRIGVERLADLIGISQISTSQPFPGTEFFAEAFENRWIFNFDPDQMRYGQMIWTPKGQFFDPQKMEALYLWAHRRVNKLDRPGGFFDRQQLVRDFRLKEAMASSP